MIDAFKSVVDEMGGRGAVIKEELCLSGALEVVATLKGVEVKMFMMPPTGEGAHVGMFSDLRVDGQMVSARGGGRITQDEVKKSMCAFLQEVKVAVVDMTAF